MQDKKVIDVVYACDSKFIPYFFVSAFSVIQNKKEYDIRFHLLFDGDNTNLALQHCIENFSGELSVYYPKDSELTNLKVNKNIPRSAYFRLLIPQYIKDASRAIYIDCDTIICSSLDRMFELDMHGKAIGAVIDAGISKSVKDKLQCDKYFNSGVLLIDLVKFQEKSPIYFSFLGRHDLITFHDQCVLNYVFKDDWIELDREWNFMSNNFTNPKLASLDFRILHFNSIFGKPWEKGCTHPFKSHYLFIKALTIYNIEPLTRPRLVVVLRNKFPLIDKVLKRLRGYK
jgi:UDP-glucose/galactose:(glucosyl)LPS alpha-1,2-glucosyl/galactosyltransferase